MRLMRLVNASDRADIVDVDERGLVLVYPEGK
jgi:hypothetical protein